MTIRFVDPAGSTVHVAGTLSVIPELSPILSEVEVQATSASMGSGVANVFEGVLASRRWIVPPKSCRINASGALRVRLIL